MKKKTFFDKCMSVSGLIVIGLVVASLYILSFFPFITFLTVAALFIAAPLAFVAGYYPKDLKISTKDLAVASLMIFIVTFIVTYILVLWAPNTLNYATTFTCGNGTENLSFHTELASYSSFMETN